jgi:diacylglycerol O-acyltransferase / wax synthase
VEQLTTLDAGFLQAEASDRHVSPAIGAIAVLAGPMPPFDALAAGLAERILTVPRFRQVLRTHPLDFSAPEWIDDATVDIAHHVRRAALPRPGDDAALFQWAAEIMEHRLDRGRPLWECWIVDGLAHNRWAILLKIHHCIADGIAASNMLAHLCDGSTGGTFTTDIRAAHEPPRGGLRLPVLSMNPVDWMAASSAHWRSTPAGILALVQGG